MYYIHNLRTGVVYRDTDNLQVAPYDYPPTEDQKAYQDWLRNGNTPTTYVPDRATDTAQLEQDIQLAVQQALDTKAQKFGYDSILAAVTYADSAIPQFAAEGSKLKAWRDLCWQYCYGLIDQAHTQSVEFPTVEQVLSGLPTLD